MKRLRSGVLVAGITLALLVGTLAGVVNMRPAYALSIGDILKVGGIVLVVTTFGNQINNFINNTLNQRDVALAGASKVVPIFSVGRGAYIGAAQVVGVPSNVQLVQGVAAVNATLGNLNGALLVPISTRIPGSSINRVSGVGISAIIDFHI